MKIRRNDYCPCGSGKKYKKCCLNKIGINGENKEASLFLPKEPNFGFLKSDAKKIYRIIKKYHFYDLIKVAFCFNSWRRNRSALIKGLTLNMALSIYDDFGTKRIENYEDLKKIHKEISKCFSVNNMVDYIIDDFGEVFINHCGKSYPVITGTGHTQVYAAMRFMEKLSSIQSCDEELTNILEYTKIIINGLSKFNRKNIECDIVYEIPTNEYWNSVNDLFNDSDFCSHVSKVSKVFGYETKHIESTHFIKNKDKIYPLFNVSLLVDYYNLLLSKTTIEKKQKHILDTISSFLLDSFNFSNNACSRILWNPLILSSDLHEEIVTQGILLAGYGDNKVLVAIDKSSFNDFDEITKVINKIKEYNQSNQMCFIDSFYDNETNGHYGFNVDTKTEIIFVTVSSYTNISEYYFSGETVDQEFDCTPLDMLYFLGFSKDLNEILDFICYSKGESANLLTIGGKSNLFFAWKSSNRIISSGAIEPTQIFIDYNQTEQYVYTYFAEVLCDFPKDCSSLFREPLGWILSSSNLNYKNCIHKGCRGFGGEVKHLGHNTHVFLAHNVEMFTEADFSQNMNTALNVIDELNQRMFLRYADLLSSTDLLRGKTLQLLYVPWEYAKKTHAHKFLSDTSRTLVFSDEYIEQDYLIVRYSLDPDTLLSKIKIAPNREIENLYFRELLQPLYKYFPEQFEVLVENLKKTALLKKTVNVFSFEQKYYFSHKSLDTEISPTSFISVKKEIAKVCMSSGIQQGEYYGEEVTNVIRKMQTVIVQLFENYIAKFDKFDLHKKVLNYYANQQNGIKVNLKRYFAFSDLDDEVLKEFEENTKTIREDYRKNAQTAQYLLESNLVVEHVSSSKICSNEDFKFLLAFADWLIVLQETADICYFTDIDMYISVDSEYRVDTHISTQTNENYNEILSRKYGTLDYSIKNDKTDEEFYEKSISAFKEDTGVDFSLLLDFLSYLQLDIVTQKKANEIYPNVFEIDKTSLITGFKEFLCEPKVELVEISSVVDFLTLDCKNLKTISGRQHEILPVWEREKRDNRFNVKPLVIIDENYIFSPVSIYDLFISWRSSLMEWYLPYEVGLTKFKAVIKNWKKRYEDEMVQDVAGLFRESNFDFVYPEIEFAKRFPHQNYPSELGDYDVIAINIKKKEIWIIECKVLQKVGSIYEDQMQQKNFFFQNKYDEKFQRRIDYFNCNIAKILQSLEIDVGEYNVVPYMITNKLFLSRYKKINFPILTFSEIEKILKSFNS